ncbi:hypothetical protein ESCO_001992 [Escovopsis weberi]|uniref:Sialidase n=1 Tax=Escovopsis weberi TaxID=150374 RepID=A0A0N0RTZ0_ESCWE|nr:hypothetical protein ESCO_001992 [Escovopsis weberi]
MSALEADIAFDFTFSSPSPSPSLDCPATPPVNSISLDGSFDFNSFTQSTFELPFNPHVQHIQASSKDSAIFNSAFAAPLDAADSIQDSCIQVAPPANVSQPFRQHGPLLLPKIRPQDQEIDHFQDFSAVSHFHQSTPPPPASAPRTYPSQHTRSFTNPEINTMAFAHMSPFATTSHLQEETAFPSSLLGSPAGFAQNNIAPPRRASCNIDTTAVEKGYSSCRQIMLLPSTPVVVAPSEYVFPSASCPPRSVSPPSMAPAPVPAPVPAPAATTPEPTPSTTLMTYLTAPNPAASLVRTISFPLRDPSIKHFWWDVRNVRSWSSFNVGAILSLPGASALLNAPVALPLLSAPKISSRHPETETGLYGIYASYYLPKLNSALALSSHRPLQLSVPAKTSSGVNDLIFVANAAGESSTAAAIFGGKPSARIVGLVRSFSRFNTGMRSEGNIKRVDYLRGLAALQYAMREHGCRYGFILTEIELVLVRTGTLPTPCFGDLEIASVRLCDASQGPADDYGSDPAIPMTACLALWGLCQLAGDVTPAGHAHWKAEIGAPAEGTRRQARPRDSWMGQPQLAEKREAKRSRGWVWPEDPIGRKELGKRGVKYGGI